MTDPTPAEAAPPPPDAGEVRTYREGVERAAEEVESWHGKGLAEMGSGAVWNAACDTLAAAIRKLP